MILATRGELLMTNARRWILSLFLAVLPILAGGCPYSHTGALPQHVQTVRVPTFKTRKNVFEYGLEGRLTRAVIERLAHDPRVQVVDGNEDAILTGTITDVDRSVLRETTTDRPSLVRLVITAKVSFEDRVEGEYLMENVTVRSSSSSAGAGIYDLERGQSPSEAETKALEALADEIVRRIIAGW
jgi:hypothetical protein